MDTDIMTLFAMGEDVLHGEGALPGEIEAAEEALGLHFAEDYREYLTRYGIAAFDGHEFTGITSTPRLSVVEVSRSGWERNPQVEKNMYVVEEGMDGMLIWQRESGEIFSTWDDGQVHKEGESLSDYLRLCLAYPG